MISQKQLRAFLKKTENKLITTSIASRLLKLNKKNTNEALAYLEEHGYIEQAVMKGYWVMSLRGKMLAHKKQEREFKATTLQQHIKDLLERAAFVNTSPLYPYYIASIKVTSQYPVEQAGAGIHIAYSLSRKKITKKQYEAAADKLRKQYKGTFGNILAYYTYPREAIRTYLKDRSHVLKLREYQDDDVKQLNGTLIFEIS